MTRRYAGIADDFFTRHADALRFAFEEISSEGVSGP